MNNGRITVKKWVTKTLTVKACDSCTVALVNGDDSAINEETATIIASSEEAIGPVTHIGDGEDVGCFDCFFCNETSIGKPQLFEGTDKP